jgi:hypothetical protein
MKTMVVISIGYCFLSSISFQFAADGSFSMRRAEEAGLVTAEYAEQHPSDVVLFKRVGAGLFEYRVRRPILGYAGVPWLIAHRTNIDLVRYCEHVSNEGCTLETDYSPRWKLPHGSPFITAADLMMQLATARQQNRPRELLQSHRDGAEIAHRR